MRVNQLINTLGVTVHETYKLKGEIINDRPIHILSTTGHEFTITDTVRVTDDCVILTIKASVKPR